MKPYRLYEGDCIDVMSQLEPESVDMILCDLPYGTTNNKWDSVIPFGDLWNAYDRVLKPDCAVVLTGQGVFTAKLIVSNEKWFKYKIVWVKSKSTNFLNANKQPLRQHEDVIVFHKGRPVYNPVMWQGEPYDKGARKDYVSMGCYGDYGQIISKSDGVRFPTDVIFCKTQSNTSICHHTQKPVALGRYLVRTYSNPGDVVLDNASGSGSFLVAAIMEERKCIGIEINDRQCVYMGKRVDYIAIAQARLEETIRNIAIEKSTPSLFDDLHPRATSGEGMDFMVNMND